MNLTKELINNLDEFIGSREIYGNLGEFFKSIEEPFEKTLYRGMNFPIHLITIGNIIEEWHGSTHWSKEISVSEQFAFDSYINEGLLEELSQDKKLLKEYGVTNVKELFRPVVLRLNENINAIDVHSVVKKCKKLKRWRKEKEVIFIGSDFMIENIEYIESEKPYYMLDVRQIRQKLT